jgi:hypothetical protein
LHYGRGLRFAPRIKSSPWKNNPILPRPRGLHPDGMLVRTPWKKVVQRQAEAPAITWLKPGKEQTRHIAFGGVPSLLHRLRGYCRVPKLGVPKLR